jgi:hypothetical protein
MDNEELCGDRKLSLVNYSWNKLVMAERKRKSYEEL